jgi:hypothetical protein
MMPAFIRNNKTCLNFVEECRIIKNKKALLIVNQKGHFQRAIRFISE